MLFNSIPFALFLPITFLIYWFVLNKNLRLQNIFVVIISYLFYGWWDWRFLFLIATTTLASYASGVLIKKYDKQEKRKFCKIIAISNIVLNLLILCIFKYLNFFSENMDKLFDSFGYQLDWVTLDILLPAGISFYTFQALSYTIDVYKKKIEPTHDIVSFFAFLSFFPTLLAGPIERATNLLPQFYKKRHFDYSQVVDGTRQILWGLFKKVVVADNCATVANEIFNNFEIASSSTLILGAIMFSIQIYGDFSGYSDMAIGIGRLFGINLMQNFNYPYFSRDIAEFWRRWHISLTTWFRDYVYIPLGGSRNGKWSSFRNTLIIFLLSGLWHGANWTFIFWGLYHALLFMPLLLLGKNRKYTDTIVAQNRKYPNLKELFQMLTTFVLVMFGWIIFRSDSISNAWLYIKRIFSSSPLSLPSVNSVLFPFLYACLGIIILSVFEWRNRRKLFGLDLSDSKTSFFVDFCLYIGLALMIFYLGGQGQTFIYFQF